MSAQRNNSDLWEPPRFRIGMSGGFGGVHGWGSPSLDLHFWKFTGRISPGLYYLSGGLTYKLRFHRWKRIRKFDRMIILSAYYGDDWFLQDMRQKELKSDLDIYMFMPGIHVDLNHYGDVYLEVSAGAMYIQEEFMTAGHPVQQHILPMGEIRIGGIFLSRKVHHQHLNPSKPKPKKEGPADKIQKKKLKFKK